MNFSRPLIKNQKLFKKVVFEKHENIIDTENYFLSRKNNSVIFFSLKKNPIIFLSLKKNQLLF